MKLFKSLLLVFSLQASAAAGIKDKKVEAFGKKSGSIYKKGSRALGGKGGKVNTVTVTLETFHKYNYFGFFFIMVHDETVGPLYTPNSPASPGMEQLCETGQPGILIDEFTGADGVFSVENSLTFLFGQNFDGQLGVVPTLTFGVGSHDFEIDVPEGYLVSMIAMIANSNDGCIILDGASVNEGDVHTLIEIDVGTEANNEECGFIAGCAPFLPTSDAFSCPCGAQSNTGDQPDGEGFMSNHDGLGLQNGGLLAQSDWRASMVTATVS